MSFVRWFSVLAQISVGLILDNTSAMRIFIPLVCSQHSRCLSQHHVLFRNNPCDTVLDLNRYTNFTTLLFSFWSFQTDPFHSFCHRPNVPTHHRQSFKDTVGVLIANPTSIPFECLLICGLVQWIRTMQRRWGIQSHFWTTGFLQCKNLRTTRRYSSDSIPCHNLVCRPLHQQ